MTLPFVLPVWLPWWAALAVLLPLALYVLALLAMPFSVLGLRGRLDRIEARLDEIQGEIRALAPLLPDDEEEEPAEEPPPRAAEARRAPPKREPRLDWPR
ncbi:MAG: hypothetical protein KGQ40_14060 [Rhodospirillales bacterium]|nr:hypothetical protein [Rhodospirillales bacterium]